MRCYLDPLSLSKTIVSVLEEAMGEDIILLDIKNQTHFADYFIFVSGTSNRMLRALTDEVLEKVRRESDVPGRVEGKPDSGWVLIDFGDVVLHIFSPDRRKYYRLEELWSEGKILLHLL